VNRRKKGSELLFLPSFSNSKRHLNDTCFAGGSALILQMISTFSSFAAPTRTTLSVAQIGASENRAERKERFLLFVFTLIIKSQQESVVIKIMNGNECMGGKKYFVIQMSV
jgi:hypothetical protein